MPIRLWGGHSLRFKYALVSSPLGFRGARADPETLGVRLLANLRIMPSTRKLVSSFCSAHGTKGNLLSSIGKPLPSVALCDTIDTGWTYEKDRDDYSRRAPHSGPCNIGCCRSCLCNVWFQAIYRGFDSLAPQTGFILAVSAIVVLLCSALISRAIQPQTRVTQNGIGEVGGLSSTTYLWSRWKAGSKPRPNFALAIRPVLALLTELSPK